jgi:Nucleoporin FG repeated region
MMKKKKNEVLKQLEKLKRDISEGLLNAEIAQRTRDAPPGLQFENVAPQEFFGRIIANFEQQVSVRVRPSSRLEWFKTGI